jgi:hypothetical protein
MKILGTIFLMLSAVGLIQVLVAMHTGRLTTITPRRSERAVMTVDRRESQRDFDGLMTYQGIMVTTFFCVGLLCLPNTPWRRDRKDE